MRVTLVAGLVWSALSGTPGPAECQDLAVVVEKNLEARMRDGVVLRADLYRGPAGPIWPSDHAGVVGSFAVSGRSSQAAQSK